MKGLKEIARLRGGPDSGTFNQIVRMMLSWYALCSIHPSQTQFPVNTFKS